MRLTRKETLMLVTLFAVTRLLLIVMGTLGVMYFPATEGAEFKHLNDGGPALDMWYRWDAGFYATIATEGYDWQNELRPAEDMVFLPLYPTLIRAVVPADCIFSPFQSTCSTLGGLIVSNASLLAATVLLFDLARRYAGKQVAWRAVTLLLLSPGSVYLSGVYTEGLFIFLCLATFWYFEPVHSPHRSHQFNLSADARLVLAVGAASLACLTRSVGVALIPALLWVAWQRWQHGGLPRPVRVLIALIPGVFFAGYVLYAGLTVGDPLAYFQTYSTVWGRTSSSPLEAFMVYFSGERIAFFGFVPSWLDLFATIGYLALAVLVLRRRVDWGLFALAALLIPIATGTLQSVPRFGVVIFPFYILLALWGRRWLVWWLIALVSVWGWLFVTWRFVTWRWIA